MARRAGSSATFSRTTLKTGSKALRSSLLTGIALRLHSHSGPLRPIGRHHGDRDAALVHAEGDLRPPAAGAALADCQRARVDLVQFDRLAADNPQGSMRPSR